MKIAVITAIYDGYDTLKEPPGQEGADVEFVCVTDNPDVVSDVWRIDHRPRPDLHPNRAAKLPKLYPWDYTDASCSVWVDGSFQITSPTFAVDLIRHADPIAQFEHPDRDCIYPEATLSMTLARYHGEPNLAQAQHYREQGHPERWGLWATGIIARHHTPEMEALSEAWHAEICRWSFQDQISEPVALRNTGLRPTAFPAGTIWSSPWAEYQGSGRHVTG